MRVMIDTHITVLNTLEGKAYIEKMKKEVEPIADKLTVDEFTGGITLYYRTYCEIEEQESESYMHRKLTNKEYLATLSAEDFYKEFKKAEKEGSIWTDTRAYVIKWLDEERSE